MPLSLEDNDELNELVLLSQIARHIRTCFDRKAQHLKLTRSQWRALCILNRNPGLKQSELAEIMEIEPISLVRLLDRMEATGWIERKPHPEDRRANLIYLTDKVEDVLGAMEGIALDLRKELLQGFTKAEHEALLKALNHIKTNITTLLSSGPTE